VAVVNRGTRLTDVQPRILGGDELRADGASTSGRQIWTGRRSSFALTLAQDGGETAAIEAAAAHGEAARRGRRRELRRKLNGERVTGVYGTRVYKPQVYKPNV